jgi:hypothetical protein
MRLLPILLLAIAVLVLILLLRRIRLPSRPVPRPIGDELVKDPVCQTYIVKSRAVRRTEAGRERYFCSEQCARLDAGG